MQIRLDVSCLTGKEESHAYLKEAFHFPEYYGCNLDALYDCLTDLGETEIVIENREAAGSYFAKVEGVLQDAARENEMLHIRE